MSVEVSPRGIAVQITHVLGTSNVNQGTSHVNLEICNVNLTRLGFLSSGVLLNSDDMLKLNESEVRFDAEYLENEFKILRLWKEGDERPDSACLLASLLARREYLFEKVLGCVEAGEMFHAPALVDKVPLHDSAIATVIKSGMVSFLVPIESLASSEDINESTSSIEQYLSEGDTIFAKVVKRDFNGVSYFRTVKCFAGTDLPGEVNSDELELCCPRRATWSSVWGDTAWFRKRFVISKRGKYWASREKKSLLVPESYNLFEKGKVFVAGKLVKPKEIKEHVGKEITVHFARECSDTDSGGRHFVAWAWIGPEPPVTHMLKYLAVPEGLVSSQWRYDVVVVEFPVPTHALCYLGNLPVLLRLFIVNESKFNLDSSFLGLIDVKVGDRLFVEVEEDPVEDSVVVWSDSKNALRAIDFPVKDVFRNLIGIIIALPEPTGKIQVADANIVVAFQLCHVRSREESKRLSLDDWLCFVCEKISVGRRVYFSAMKIESAHEPYRAYEVYCVD